MVEKFLGLRRLTFLLERLKRTLDFSSTTIKDVTLENPTATGTVTGFGGSGAVSAVGNGADNRVATFSSSDALNGEANLTFDGSTLTVAAATAVNLQSDAVNIGEDGDTDVVLTFKGNTSDGVVTWMEDEDEFRFSDSVRGKMLHYTYHNYYSTSTSLHYIPINSTIESTDIETEYNHWLVPHNGKLLKIIVNADGDHAGSGTAPGSTVIGLHLDRNTTAAVTVTETLAQASAGVGINKTFTFSSSNTFTAGQFIAISVDPTAGVRDMRMTCVWEYDTTT